MEKPKTVIDYKNLTPELLELFDETYADGLAGKTIRFPSGKNLIITAARLETEDRVYLVKINSQAKEAFDDGQIDDFLDNFGANDDEDSPPPDADFEAPEPTDSDMDDY